MSSQSSCSVTGCSEPPYTPSGMMNFSCKFWRNKEKSKQQQIRLNMETNLSMAEESRKTAISLDKLVHIRDTFREINVDFDARSYVKNHNFEIDDVYESLSEFFEAEEEVSKIKAIDAKVNDVSEVLSTPVSEFLNGDVQQKLESANKIIQDLKSSIKDLNEYVSEINSNYKSRVKQRLEIIKAKFSDEMITIKKILDNNESHINMGSLSSYIQQHELSPDDEEMFNKFIRYQRFLVRKKIVKRNTKKTVLVIRDVHIAIKLFSDFPNLIHICDDSWKRKTELSFDKLHESSINIVSNVDVLKKEYIERINLILFDRGNYDVPPDFQHQVARSQVIFMKPFFEFDLLQRSNDPGFILEYTDDLTYTDEYQVENTLARIRNENGIQIDPGNDDKWENTIFN